jgi:hypothetical protein
MKKKESPQKQFESTVEYYFNVLKNGFLDCVENSTDKQYSHAHYKKIFFEYNQFIPYNTVFFHELKITFEHFLKLDNNNVIDNVFSYLPEIRQISLKAYEQLNHLLETKKETSFSDLAILPYVYTDAVCDDLNGNTLEELAQLEKITQEFEHEDILAILALYHAIQICLKDKDIVPISNSASSDEAKRKAYKHKVTRSQQMLLCYYFIKMGGIDPRVDTHVSSCAELLHGLCGLPYNEIGNSDFYKKFKNPLDYANPKTVLKDLEYVLSIFKKINHDRIIIEITKDIRGLSSE